MTIERNDIRPAVYAGSWYEDDPARLRAAVDSYMDRAEIPPDLGIVYGIISPHAGHIYSGHVAGYAYKPVRGNVYDTVIVVAPNHADPALTFTSIYARGGYETPLGVIPVDTETATLIAEYDSDNDIRISDYGHMSGFGGRMEHSLEIQLPFLQAALGEFRLVPVVMGNRDGGRRSCTALGNAIAAAVDGKNTLVVASTDLSHFHDAETLKALDDVVAEHVRGYDPEGLLRDINAGVGEACGALPTAAVMIACRSLGATEGVVLKMAHSGEISGDYTSAVGYMAAVLTGPE